MSASRPQNAVVSYPSSKPSPTSNPAWLEALLFNAKLITAGADAFPFPYVKGVFGTVVFLLEAVQKVKQNQESMKELCGDTVDIITILRDQISAHGDTIALKFKTQCEELEMFLQDVLEAVNQLRMKPQGFGSRLKEIIKASSTMDDISRFRTRMRELRSNFMGRVFNLIWISAAVPVAQVPQQINNCPLPSRIFHGRQTILQKMHQYFATTGKQDIFLLHGLGGAGKTQIALKFISESTSKSEKYSHDKDCWESSHNVLQWLQSKQEEWLLLFDNADDPKINLNDYIPQCDHGNILITSRNPGLVVYASSHSLVSDMEEIDAVDLLLRSAGQETTDHNRTTAGCIVKMLQYLPLAIIQAGSFISKAGDLDSYLALYKENQARLLSQKPAQSHDNYAWTVYTTWQISFNQLSQPAASFLQLCSLLHHQGISEQIFQNAAAYKFGPSSPSKEELQMPIEFLSQFLGPDGVWDSFCFMNMTNEVRAYSLINFHPQKRMFSMHPLVHDWTRNTLSNKESYHHCMVAIIGMSLAGLSDNDLQLASQGIQPHIDFLIQANSNVIPDFRHEYAKIYVWGENLKKAEQLEVAVLQERRDLLGEDHQDTLDAMYWLAWTYMSLGRFKEAERLEVVVLQQRRHILGDDHLATLDVMANLAFTYNRLGKLREAEELEVVVLEKRRNVLDNNHPDILMSMGNLAATYNKLGKLKEAEELEIMVLEKRMNLLGDNHPATLITMVNLAFTYQTLGKLKEAEELGVRVLERRRNLLGDSHPSTLGIMAHLAVTYRNLGKLKEAEELEVVVLEKQRNILGENHPETLVSMGNLAVTYQRLGKLKEAEELEVAVLDKRSNLLGDNHPHTLRAMGNLAATYNKLERWQEAEKLGVVALKKHMEILGGKHKWTLEAMQNLAVTYEQLGKLSEAEALNTILRGGQA
ncbi:hypothetical protein C8R44DRAFT_853416 [Mycena epipterygia]|nr:hypothetical protein C8R44DRAFT_853416 [Mycena epipterygia]